MMKTHPAGFPPFLSILGYTYISGILVDTYEKGLRQELDLAIPLIYWKDVYILNIYQILHKHMKVRKYIYIRQGQKANTIWLVE